MPMSRAEKVERVATIRSQISAVDAIYLTEFRGLSVKEVQQVRRSLLEQDARMRVVKMSLARRAMEEMGHEGLSDHLSGPTALVFAEGDPLTAARTVREQARQYRNLTLKGGDHGWEVLRCRPGGRVCQPGIQGPASGQARRRPLGASLQVGRDVGLLHPLRGRCVLPTPGAQAVGHHSLRFDTKERN